MMPLGYTNKAACGVKLLPLTVLAWQVHCGCFCILLNIRTMAVSPCPWMVNPAFGFPPIPTTPYPSFAHPPLYTESMIRVRKMLPVKADLVIFSPVIGVYRVWLSCQAIKWNSVLAGLCIPGSVTNDQRAVFY